MRKILVAATVAAGLAAAALAGPAGATSAYKCCVRTGGTVTPAGKAWAAPVAPANFNKKKV